MSNETIARDLVDSNYASRDDDFDLPNLYKAVTSALDAKDATITALEARLETATKALEEIRQRGWATEDHDTRKNLADVAATTLAAIREGKT